MKDEEGKKQPKKVAQTTYGEKVFLKLEGARRNLMLLDIDIARDSTKFKAHVLQHLDMPSDSLIRTRRYGRDLKDY